MYVQGETMTVMKDTPSVRAADRAMIVICWAATVLALVLSYRGLYDFATQRGGYPRWAALAFPVIVDFPLVLGELRLFTIAARGETGYIKGWAWLLTVVGLLVSLAGNIAHVGPGSTVAMQLAAAVPPLAVAVSLGTGLGIIKLRAGRAKPATGQVADATPRPPAALVLPARDRVPATAAVDVPELQRLMDADRAAGLPTGRAAFAARHREDGWTEHRVRVTLAAVNGS
jgi:hypothetical protein